MQDAVRRLLGCGHHQHDDLLQERVGFLRADTQVQTGPHVSCDDLEQLRRTSRYLGKPYYYKNNRQTPFFYFVILGLIYSLNIMHEIGR